MPMMAEGGVVGGQRSSPWSAFVSSCLFVVASFLGGAGARGGGAGVLGQFFVVLYSVLNFFGIYEAFRSGVKLRPHLWN